MPDLTDLLDEIQDRADRATDGPWSWASHVTVDGDSWADAEFIVDARTALPKALAALEAVLAMHHPVKIYAQADECGCGDEDHTIIESPQGDDLCWDTPTGELCCSECLDEDSGAIDYPCPTVVLIREALGVES